MSPARQRVVGVDLARTRCRARLPFRFGAVTVREADLLTCRVAVETALAGAPVRAHGWSADLLVPKWFRKDLAREPGADAEALEQSARAAAADFVEATRAAVPVQEASDLAFAARVGAQSPDAPDLLERGFGVALVERAMLDAACRAAGLSFAAALRADLFGAGTFPAADGTEIELRHTVGMLDPLRAAEIPPGARIADGEPQALDEEIAARGLRRFKVKIGAGHAADRARLLALARLFADLDLAPRITLDGNEQFVDLGALADLLDAVRAEPDGARLLARLDFIEQPLPRAVSFDAAALRGLARVAAFAPLVLDEADALPGDLARAAACGWRGLSVKCCKGALRAVRAARACAASGGALFQTSEDLTNLPLLPLQQDLCLAAALGLRHAERNGHHYFRGLDHLPPAAQAAACAAHPDLYRARADGGAALRVAGGRLQFASAVRSPGFGCALDGHADGLQVVATA